MTDPRRLRSTARYQRARAAFLAANPLCMECERRGIVTAAAELDHVEPVHLGGAFWDSENWAALCRDCHRTKTEAERRGPRVETPEQQAWRERVESMLA